jgi:tetratricopeptide (TPR) repeat protein
MPHDCLRRAAIALGAAVCLSATAAVRAAGGQPIDAAAPAGSAAAAAHRARGLEFGYNLDHDKALAEFRAAIAADPDHPAAYRLVAATLWIDLLFRQGAVTVDDYLGQARANVVRTPPAPELAGAFRAHIERALALGERSLRLSPLDPDAHFQIGAAHGFLTSYGATVEGRVLGGFRAARRAYNAHERVLALDPRRKDAGLIVGMYRYAVSTLSPPMRLLAGIAGFGGGRRRGLRMVEEAAAYPSDVQTNARFTLIVMYTREARFDDALRVIEELQRLYPRNRLLWLEAGSAALRADRPDEARRILEAGLAKLSRDPRPRAFGEESRWRYQLGAALVASGQADAAGRELRAVLDGEAPEWLRGRAHKELGKLADLAGARSRALEEYRLAARICRAHHDTECATEAAGLIRTRYR